MARTVLYQQAHNISRARHCKQRLDLLVDAVRGIIPVCVAVNFNFNFDLTLTLNQFIRPPF